MTTDSTNPLEFNAPEWLLNKNGDVGSGQVEEQYPYLTTAFTIAYSMVTVLSLVGNSLILVVLLRRKRMRRTVTNFFLANITIANLVYTICAPLQFFVHAHHIVLPWGTACTLLPFASTLAINVNTFSMMAASVERFVAIVYPFVAKLKKRKCGFIIAAIWIVSIVVSLPWFLLVRAKPVQSKSPANVIDSYSDFRKMMLNPSHNSNHSMSNEDVAAATTSNNSNDDPYEQLKFPPDEINDLMYDHLSSMVKPSDILDLDGGSSVELCEPIDGLLVRARLYSLFLCLVQYFLPLLVLMLTYMIIAYYVYVINTASGSQHQLDSRSMRSTTSSTTTSSYSNMLGKNKKKLVKMLILIIICFNVCWMPLQLHAAIQAINPHFITSKLSLEAQKYIWMSIHFLAFSHFCHNPFINGFLNRKFKHELISFFKYGYNRLKAFILYKSCKWIMKSRRGPFESTSVEMNKNNLSSLKVRDKSMYLLDGNNDLKEIERDQEIDELFNEINPGCLLGPIGRQFMIDKQVQQNETMPIKKESLSSSDKTSSNNKKKSSSSTTSSSSAAAAAAAAASALGASAAVVVAVGVVPSDKKTKQVHHLKPEAYSHSLGQQVSSIDSINNLNNSRAKFKSPKTSDHRKRVIYSFHSKTAAVNQLSPPSIAVYSALNNSSSSCNLGGSRRTRSSTLIANEILSATPSPLLISPATECVSMLSTTPTTPSVHFNHPLFYEAPSRNTRYGGAVKLTPNHPSAYSLATSNSASSFNNMKKTSKSL